MDIRKYIYSHCIEPRKVPIFDAFSQTTQIREVPCGKCLHCRNNHTGEWITRLYAQSLYSPYVYYITLDYAPFDLRNAIARKLAADTAACYHNINVYHSYGMHPILLQKFHLQQFFKRFRKNTGKKIQYFACGEYGTHANGKGYGRPHFHVIVYSDKVISPKEFEDAWTLNGYQIGRVDFNDLRANGSFDDIKVCNNKYNSKYVFKYVCKYLQKGSFDFESLATIEYHRTYFNSLQEVLIKTDTLFPEVVPLTDPKQIERNWSDYVSKYSPFVVCSKRPSIGLQYFKDNCERFREQDFKLFGLPKECVTFPLYYVRKTKESLCPFSAIGRESGQVSSNSRVGTILQVLRQVMDTRLSIANLGSFPEESWSTSKLTNDILGHENCNAELHMYDNINRTFYQYNGYSYTLWKRVHKIGFVRMCDMDISEVINHVEPYWQEFHSKCLMPSHNSKVLAEEDLNDSIRAIYGDNTDKFREEVQRVYDAELSLQRKNKLLTQNSKLTL